MAQINFLEKSNNIHTIKDVSSSRIYNGVSTSILSFVYNYCEIVIKCFDK